MESNRSKALQRLQACLQLDFATFASLQTPIYAFANLQTFPVTEKNTMKVFSIYE